jgi:hypothetical protein
MKLQKLSLGISTLMLLTAVPAPSLTPMDKPTPVTFVGKGPADQELLYRCETHGHTVRRDDVQKYTKEHGCKGWSVVKQPDAVAPNFLSVAGSFVCRGTSVLQPTPDEPRCLTTFYLP